MQRRRAPFLEMLGLICPVKPSVPFDPLVITGTLWRINSSIHMHPAIPSKSGIPETHLDQDPPPPTPSGWGGSLRPEPESHTTACLGFCFVLFVLFKKRKATEKQESFP